MIRHKLGISVCKKFYSYQIKQQFHIKNSVKNDFLDVFNHRVDLVLPCLAIQTAETCVSSSENKKKEHYQKLSLVIHFHVRFHSVNEFQSLVMKIQFWIVTNYYRTFFKVWNKTGPQNYNFEILITFLISMKTQ